MWNLHSYIHTHMASHTCMPYGMHGRTTTQVWDNFGRLLFQSAPFEYSVTAVSWCPSGELFAAGSFDSLYLCDRMGWSYSKV